MKSDVQADEDTRYHKNLMLELDNWKNREQAIPYKFWRNCCESPAALHPTSQKHTTKQVQSKQKIARTVCASSTPPPIQGSAVRVPPCQRFLAKSL
eukprot:1453176-Amphidinium_carterae.1